MAINIVQRQKLLQQVERVLHVPGNFTKEILEMALILDCAMEKDDLEETVIELVKTLKGHSQVFRNVRLNVLWWKDEEKIEATVAAMPRLMMPAFYQEYHRVKRKKTLAKLAGYLKMYYARSKLIIVVTDGSYEIGDTEQARRNGEPFLKRKFLLWRDQEVFDYKETLVLEEKNGESCM